MSLVKYVVLKLEAVKTIIVEKYKFIILINPTLQSVPVGQTVSFPWITVQRLELEAAKRRAT